MAVEGKFERRNWKWNNSSTRSGNTNKNHATKILQTETDDKCRLCQQSDETVEHIISACSILTKEQYTWDMIKCVCGTTL